MGLKDELVVANDPVEETEQAETEGVSQDAGATEIEQTSLSDDSQIETVSISNNDETVEVVTVEEPVEEIAEDNVAEEEEEEEEDVEDPMEAMKEKCSEHADAMKYKAVLDECTERVSSKENTAETCTQELFDFLHSVDHCVSKSLFTKLK